MSRTRNPRGQIAEHNGVTYYVGQSVSIVAGLHFVGHSGSIVEIDRYPDGSEEALVFIPSAGARDWVRVCHLEPVS